MPTQTKERPKIPFNPAVMRWARERALATYEEAAGAAGVESERLEEWEAGRSSPTVRQARALAKLYERPFLEFFAPTTPEFKSSQLMPDFRLTQPNDKTADERGLKSIQEWAETQRLNAIDLYEMLDDLIPSIPAALVANENDNPEIIATLVRSAFKITPDMQFGLNQTQRGQFPKYLRRTFEHYGILVLKKTELKNYGARGMCIYAQPIPVIVFGDESAGGQVFTLLHEVAHIVLRQSAISGGVVSQAASGRPAIIERWCNRFASSFLAPAEMVRDKTQYIKNIWAGIEEVELNALANWFAISRHAMLIRLVELGIVDPDFYWGKMRKIFTVEEAKFKSFGRPKFYSSRYRSSNGDKYVSLVLEAWETGQITTHNAGEFLGIKNPKHLFDIRNNFDN